LTGFPHNGKIRGMDILETFKADVRAKRGRLAEVAEGSGLKPKTLRNILYGESTNPRYNTVEKLRAFYQRRRETDQA
jgi:transcriptional regulator with XRE-family HTH domain